MPLGWRIWVDWAANSESNMWFANAKKILNILNYFKTFSLCLRSLFGENRSAGALPLKMTSKLIIWDERLKNEACGGECGGAACLKAEWEEYSSTSS